MVKITLNNTSQEITGSTINAFEKLGVSMDCHNGICGLCKIKVIDGMKNMNPKTPEEEDFPLDTNERLACQCSKITGDIKIENAEW